MAAGFSLNLSASDFHHLCAVGAKSLLRGEGVAVIVSRLPISAGINTISRLQSPFATGFPTPEGDAIGLKWQANPVLFERSIKRIRNKRSLQT